MALHFHTTGPPDGRPVLFLHGFMGSGADWQAVAEALGPAFYCLAPDLPGHGRSVQLPTPHYTMAGAATLLREGLAARGLTRCAVVGYSMGGRLALYFALHHPAQCSHLVLESASPGLRTAAERAARRTLDEARATQLETEPLAAFLDHWYRHPLFADLADHPEAYAAMRRRRLHNQPEELARALRLMGTGAQPSLWERLHTRTGPWLVLAGALDAKFTAIGQAMTANHPQARFVAVPGAGHNIHLTCMNAYTSLLNSFLLNPGDAR